MAEPLNWFGNILKQLREKAGLSQVELAQMASLTKNTIASLEQGVNRPKWETVIMLAGALEVETDEFIPSAKIIHSMLNAAADKLEPIKDGPIPTPASKDLALSVQFALACNKLLRQKQKRDRKLKEAE